MICSNFALIFFGSLNIKNYLGEQKNVMVYIAATSLFIYFP